MLDTIIVIFLALLFYFSLKMLYHVVILIVIVQLVGKAKAKGQEILKNKNAQTESEENGEKG